MSIHSSLRTGGKGKKHRSVLKRYERLRVLQQKGLWDTEKSVLGISKVKMQKIKIKKEKAAPAEGSAPVTGKPPVSGVTASAPAPGGKNEKASKTDKK